MPRSQFIRRAATLAIAGAALAAASGASALTGPLRTDGAKIVNSLGTEVVLQGVNWFGLETANHAPHGLWARDYRDMLAQIKAQGFNTIRLPFSLQAPRSTTTSGIDYANGRNAVLQARTALSGQNIVTHHLRPMLNAAGIMRAGIGFHALRHYYATRLLVQGYPVPVVARLLGHSDNGERVMRTYSHVLASDLPSCDEIARALAAGS